VLSSAVPFTSLSILWKFLGQNDVAEPNWDVLNFSSSTFSFAGPRTEHQWNCFKYQLSFLLQQYG
jgi:hypothetical protein